MFALACIAISAVIVAAVVVVAVLDWAGHLPLIERLALYAICAGLVWASPSWFVAHRPPGFGDVLFLTGVGLLMAARYGRAIERHISPDHGLNFTP